MLGHSVFAKCVLKDSLVCPSENQESTGPRQTHPHPGGQKVSHSIVTPCHTSHTRGLSHLYPHRQQIFAF